MLIFWIWIWRQPLISLAEIFYTFILSSLEDRMEKIENMPKLVIENSY